MKDHRPGGNISDFLEMKQRLEQDVIPKNTPETISGAQNNLQGLFQHFGLDDEKMQQLMRELDFEHILTETDLSSFSVDDILAHIDSLKDYEQSIKKEKDLYRRVHQWIPFHRPYNLSTLYPIESIHSLADACSISYTSQDSKNAIIERVQPKLTEYVEDFFRHLDSDTMLRIGDIIYSGGYDLVEEPLYDEDEMILDFLTRKCFLMRVNDFGRHALVIPDEILYAIHEINFKKMAPYHKLNQYINQTALAYANSYGASPFSLLLETVMRLAGEEIKELGITDQSQYIHSILNFSFSGNIFTGAMYANVIVSDEYVSHAMVEVTKALIDIQNKDVLEYKPLTKDEIVSRGHAYYYDNVLAFNQVMNTLQALNVIDGNELDQLRNQISIFSFLEFEPSIILQMLELRYQLPEGQDYTRFLELLRTYYRNAPKWILKGHTSYELNHKFNHQSTEDIKKIIKVDF